MDRPTKPQNAAQKSAQTYFNKAAQDDSVAKQSRKKERATADAKTAKLRALRMAKEAADKQEADRLAAEPGHVAPTPRRKRAAPAKPTVQRFTY
jgi:hypothetical protein